MPNLSSKGSDSPWGMVCFGNTRPDENYTQTLSTICLILKESSRGLRWWGEMVSGSASERGCTSPKVSKLLHKRQGQNLSLTDSCVPYSRDSGRLQCTEQASLQNSRLVFLEGSVLQFQVFAFSVWCFLLRCSVFSFSGLGVLLSSVRTLRFQERECRRVGQAGPMPAPSCLDAGEGSVQMEYWPKLEFGPGF